MCMTAATDVARFVTKALDLPQWPPELRMCGQRVLVKDVVALVQQLKRQRFHPIGLHSPETLRAELQLAQLQQDNARRIRILGLLATTEGRYDFQPPNMNQHFQNDIRPVTFQEWFITKWNGR